MYDKVFKIIGHKKPPQHNIVFTILHCVPYIYIISHNVSFITMFCKNKKFTDLIKKNVYDKEFLKCANNPSIILEKLEDYK